MLNEILLLADTAALTLIWLVQLVIYPSFAYYKDDQLKQWHPIYTRRVTIIVLPIMIAQLLVYCLAIYSSADWTIVLRIALIASVWVVTFARAVPLHHNIDTQVNTANYCRKLVKVNWTRTILWSLVFIISVTKYTLDGLYVSQ